MSSAKCRNLRACLWLLVVFLLLAAIAVPYGISVVHRDIMFGESAHVMKMVMVGLTIYADENDGFFPPEDGIAGLRMILTPPGGRGIGPKQLTCSSKFPRAVSIGEVDEPNTSYIYIGGHGWSSPPHTIVLIEKPSLGYKGTHVGLPDGQIIDLKDMVGP